MPRSRQILTKEEADDHLRDIRKRKGVDSFGSYQSDNVGDLNRALQLLSKELYSKPTHFLLELIQNADDNTFDSGVIPSLTFRTKLPGTDPQICINCNEVGFTKDNVEALCRIGNSTKKLVDRRKGFIGEKGIGFKSVFKVADIVHISSSAYSFRFDSSELLGMITPITESFPSAQYIEGQTQMLLDLKGTSELRSINKDLHEIEPQLLIFLRKLQKIIIHTPLVNREFEAEKTKYDEEFKGETMKLWRKELPRKKEAIMKYLIVRRAAGNLPLDSRRDGVTETEIVLAFPISEYGQPLLKSQDTYAYLPIGNYGFCYLIQADFLLTADRESVDTSDWNDHLRHWVVKTFVGAVSRFNSIGDDTSDENSDEGSDEDSVAASDIDSLRYTWPLFLKDRDTTTPFWSELKPGILSSLKKRAVLRSRAGTLCCPKDLNYIPLEYRLSGKPLLDREDAKSNYLSFLYNLKVKNILDQIEAMGVSKMKFKIFFEELRKCIDEEDHFLDRQSSKWHSKIASLFLDHGQKAQAFQLPLIPLRDGRWVAPDESHLFLNRSKNDPIVPQGIEICLVDDQACQDKNRKEFFKWLGIKKCRPGDVCRMIMELHSKKSRARRLEDWVSDAIYLFRTPLSAYNESIKKLRLAESNSRDMTQLDEMLCGDQLYIDVPSGPSFIKKFAHYPAKVTGIKLVHPMYLEEARKLRLKSEFVEWMHSRLMVSNLPRLVDWGGGFPTLTPEFRFLRKEATSDLILLVRDNWEHYSQDIQDTHLSTSPLRQAMSKLNVPCTDGSIRRLYETVLPSDSLKSAGNRLPFIDVSNPNEPSWLNFSAFGVITTPTMDLYLRELIALAALPVNEDVTKALVEGIYIQICFRTEMDSVDEADKIEAAFKELPLVFLPRQRKWVFLSNCVWKSLPCLQSVYSLHREYESCHVFFHQRLGLSNATIDHVVEELLDDADRRPTNQVRELLVAVNNFLKRAFSLCSIDKLRGKRIIPVKTCSGKTCLMRYDKDLFYLADRPSLYEAFKGRLPLVDFTVDQVRDLSTLIDAMELRDFLLSQSVIEELHKVGIEVSDRQKTKDLRMRARYFTRLVPDTIQKSKSRLTQLSACLAGLTVWGVDKIRITRKIDDVEGVEDTGIVVFDQTDEEKLDIYVSSDPTKQGLLNCQLSEEFIKYCEISKPEYRQLVLKILILPLTEIERYLEDYDLDSRDAANQMGPNSQVFSPFEQFDENIPETAISLRTSGTSLDMCLGRREGPLSLRETIPTLDQAISSVRQAASSQEVQPGRLTRQFRSDNDERPTKARSCVEPEINDTRIGSDASSPGSSRPQSSSTNTTADQESFSFGNIFVGDLRSTLPQIDVSFQRPSRASGMPSGQPSNLREKQNADDTAQGLRNQFIGVLGEVFVNEWLSRQLGAEWLPNYNWTSRNRIYDERNIPFTGLEKDFADFTYYDGCGKLTRLLGELDFLTNADDWLRSPPTYHLEVKSTTEECNEPFFMSNNQLEMARSYTIPSESTRIPDHVYVLVRVYNLGRESTPPDFALYIDPWSMYLKGELVLRARDNYVVTLKINST